MYPVGVYLAICTAHTEMGKGGTFSVYSKVLVWNSVLSQRVLFCFQFYC